MFDMRPSPLLSALVKPNMNYYLMHLQVAAECSAFPPQFIVGVVVLQRAVFLQVGLELLPAPPAGTRKGNTLTKCFKNMLKSQCSVCCCRDSSAKDVINVILLTDRG